MTTQRIITEVFRELQTQLCKYYRTDDMQVIRECIICHDDIFILFENCGVFETLLHEYQLQQYLAKFCYKQARRLFHQLETLIYHRTQHDLDTTFADIVDFVEQQFSIDVIDLDDIIFRCCYQLNLFRTISKYLGQNNSELSWQECR